MQNINTIIIELLAKRGIQGEAEIKEFLAEKPKKTYDPFLLPDLEAGVDLILDAIRTKKKICIYGDYDADGVTSSSILMEFLGQLTNQLDYYIPLRIEEGYGLNKSAIQKIHENGTQLLITVDCGSVSYEEVELAKQLGMDVLVTDHHSITDVQADCLLINPKRKDSKYPFSELAGCGVAFKLIQGIQKKLNLPKNAMNRSLDLVALGTIADVVPLLDENRTLVKYGMRIMKQGARNGLTALVEGAELNKEVLRSDQIAFVIAPHINAAGRMGDAKIAVDLMLDRNPKTIDGKVNQLVAYNKERKEFQETAFDQCVEIVEEQLIEKPILLLYMDDIHEGIAGIVAGKLKEKYQRPVIIVTPSGDGLKGTGRSIPGVHLYQLLQAHEEFFTRFGGHEGACGFSMAQDRYMELCDVLEAEMQRRLEENPDLLEIPIEADMELEGEQVTLELAKTLDLLAPFGSKNPKPYFLLGQAELERITPMGDGRHVRFTASCSDGYAVECVLFGKAKDLEDKIYSGLPVDLIGTVDWQEWRGTERVQFTVETIR